MDAGGGSSADVEGARADGNFSIKTRIACYLLKYDKAMVCLAGLSIMNTDLGEDRN